jgi:hypothetical protein
MPIPNLNDQVAINASLPKREIFARWLIGVQGFGETGDYATLPERYLLAKIAVAYGCPRAEVDYISLPKQYVWSDIYNAISGDTSVHYDWAEKQALGWILGATYGDQNVSQFLAYYIDLPIRIQLALLVELNGGTPPPPVPTETFFIEYNDSVDVGDLLYDDGEGSAKLIYA